jgi:2-isopropylmalate synthase
VGALDGALRKALTPVYPALADIHLADYKVRILDGADGTQATTRVLIDSKSGERTWSTVGASPNIIQASLEALVDSIEYGLLQSGVRLDDAAVARHESERPPPRSTRATP